MYKALKTFAATAGMVVVGAVVAGLLMVVEALVVRKQRPLESGLQFPVRSGLFGDSNAGEPLELAMLGDSLAVGFGAEDPDHGVGVLLAEGLAAGSGRPVQLRNVAVVGAESKDLAGQITCLTREDAHLEVVVIVVGGNDIMHLQRIGSAVQYLASAVQELRGRCSHVVVATCPDMGTVRIFVQPLRYFAHLLSRILATAQTIAVLRAGGRTVSLADTLGPIFRQDPDDMFSRDHVHPSSEGYALAAEVLLPSVCAAAGYWTGIHLSLPHRVYRHDRHIHRLAWFAFRAVRHAGSEVSPMRGHEENRIQVVRRTVDRHHGEVLPLAKHSEG